MSIKDDPVLGLELVLTHYQGRLKDSLNAHERDKYETMYLQEYHELHNLDKAKSKPYMEWWVRYDKL